MPLARKLVAAAGVDDGVRPPRAAAGLAVPALAARKRVTRVDGAGVAWAVALERVVVARGAVAGAMVIVVV